MCVIQNPGQTTLNSAKFYFYFRFDNINVNEPTLRKQSPGVMIGLTARGHIVVGNHFLSSTESDDTKLHVAEFTGK